MSGPLSQTLRDSGGGEHRWVHHYLPPEDAIPLSVEIAPIVGQSIAAMGEGATPAAVAESIGNAFAMLKGGDPIRLIKRVLAASERDGVSAVDSLAWSAGNYGELRDAVMAAARHNFASFFDGLAPAPQPSPKGSTGATPAQR